MTQRRRDLDVERPYAVPLALALSTAIGLSSALFGEGVWDVVSWIALAPPLVVLPLALLRRARPRA